jgi:hypothetical protein
MFDDLPKHVLNFGRIYDRDKDRLVGELTSNSRLEQLLQEMLSLKELRKSPDKTIQEVVKIDWKELQDRLHKAHKSYLRDSKMLD